MKNQRLWPALIFADGGILTGEQACDLELVDRIGKTWLDMLMEGAASGIVEPAGMGD